MRKHFFLDLKIQLCRFVNGRKNEEIANLTFYQKRWKVFCLFRISFFFYIILHDDFFFWGRYWLCQLFSYFILKLFRLNTQYMEIITNYHHFEVSPQTMQTVIDHSSIRSIFYCYPIKKYLKRCDAYKKNTDRTCEQITKISMENRNFKKKIPLLSRTIFIVAKIVLIFGCSIFVPQCCESHRCLM